MREFFCENNEKLLANALLLLGQMTKIIYGIALFSTVVGIAIGFCH